MLLWSFTDILRGTERLPSLVAATNSPGGLWEKLLLVYTINLKEGFVNSLSAGHLNRQLL